MMKSIDELRKLKKDISLKIDYYRYLIVNLEAKIERVEPLSNEFETIVQRIFTTREKINNLNINLIKVKIQIDKVERNN